MPIFSIGHSNQSFSEFLELLRENAIESLMDIWSFRTSYYPQFRCKNLETALRGGYAAYAELPDFLMGLLGYWRTWPPMRRV